MCLKSDSLFVPTSERRVPDQQLVRDEDLAPGAAPGSRLDARGSESAGDEVTAVLQHRVFHSKHQYLVQREGKERWEPAEALTDVVFLVKLFHWNRGTEVEDLVLLEAFRKLQSSPQTSWVVPDMDDGGAVVEAKEALTEVARALDAKIGGELVLGQEGLFIKEMHDALVLCGTKLVNFAHDLAYNGFVAALCTDKKQVVSGMIDDWAIAFNAVSAEYLFADPFVFNFFAERRKPSKWDMKSLTLDGKTCILFPCYHPSIMQVAGEPQVNGHWTLLQVRSEPFDGGNELMLHVKRWDSLASRDLSPREDAMLQNFTKMWKEAHGLSEAMVKTSLTFSDPDRFWQLPDVSSCAVWILSVARWLLLDEPTEFPSLDTISIMRLVLTLDVLLKRPAKFRKVVVPADVLTPLDRVAATGKPAQGESGQEGMDGVTPGWVDSSTMPSPAIPPRKRKGALEGRIGQRRRCVLPFACLAIAVSVACCFAHLAVVWTCSKSLLLPYISHICKSKRHLVPCVVLTSIDWTHADLVLIWRAAMPWT